MNAKSASTARPATLTARALLAAAAALASAGCGADDPSGGSELGFTVAFSLSKGGDTPVDCSAVAQVRRVQVRVLSADGLSLLPGWPRDADCATGSFSDATLAPGRYTLELVATGDLFDDGAATLFKVRRTLDLPADRAVVVSLAPEVAFLEVTWSFAPTNDLSPCAGIDDLSLFLSTGASGSYQKTNIDCTTGRFQIPTLLLPQSFTLRMEAYNTDRDTVYEVTETRLLQRGQNPPFAVVFQRLRGDFVFDWAFSVGAASTMACDDQRVGVSTLDARVTSMDGDDPLEATIPCMGQRPVRLPSARFAQGQRLVLTLVAEGAQRFRVQRAFVASAGDSDLGFLTLPAVGSATITVGRLAMGSACPGTIDGLRARVTVVGERTPVFEAQLPATGGMLPVVDVPLGDYTVVIEGLEGMAAACRVEAPRSITGRTNRWEPFEL